MCINTETCIYIIMLTCFHVCLFSWEDGQSFWHDSGFPSDQMIKYLTLSYDGTFVFVTEQEEVCILLYDFETRICLFISRNKSKKQVLNDKFSRWSCGGVKKEQILCFVCDHLRAGMSCPICKLFLVITAHSQCFMMEIKSYKRCAQAHSQTANTPWNWATTWKMFMNNNTMTMHTFMYVCLSVCVCRCCTQ